jgi:hypothetical protein
MIVKEANSPEPNRKNEIMSAFPEKRTTTQEVLIPSPGGQPHVTILLGVL